MSRVVLVTGSSSGIGAATARAFAAAGDLVVINSRSSVTEGKELADRLPGAMYVQADVSAEGDVDRLINAVVARHGRLDAVINNAGTTEVIPHGDLDAAGPEVWRRLYDVNVIGPWLVSRAAAPHLRASDRAVIVNVSSLAGVRPVGSSIPYACSKAALNHQTLLLANILGPTIRVVAVAPGLVDTPWTTDDSGYWNLVRQFVLANAPLQRSATPEDVAHAIVSLADNAYVTGQILVLDGGLSLR